MQRDLLRTSFFFCLVLIQISALAQPTPQKYFAHSDYKFAIDSLDQINGYSVLSDDDRLRLATNICLKYYPELAGNKVKIKFKKSVRHPITASWAFSNIWKLRKNHTYVLLIHPDSFVSRLNLNGEIGIIGHEMDHFKYYKEHPGIHMLWWGLKYTLSKKFSRRFERETDFTAVDHGLGYQVLEILFYTREDEIREYMRETGIY